MIPACFFVYNTEIIFRRDTSMTNRVDPIVTEARELHKRFEEMIQPHRTALWNYCRTITGSSWDGDDLFQDTLLKAFATLTQMWHALHPKSYLFRIATNTWIDQLRRNKVKLDSYEDSHGHTVDPDRSVVTEAVEVLVTQLPPRQAAVLLLMDVFEFKALESASMLKMTEGGVYSALHRARNNLRALPRRAEKEPEPVPSHATHGSHDLIQQLVTAMNEGNTAFLVEVMSASIHNNASPGFQEYSKDDMLGGSFGHKPARSFVEYRELWGRHVIVAQEKNSDGTLELHDIREYEVQNGQVVYHRGYYFCKELLFAAGRELGIPVQLKKAPGLNWES